MPDVLKKMDGFITLTGFHRDFLSAMLDVPMPQLLSVTQAKVLLTKIRAVASNCSYSDVVHAIVDEIEAPWAAGRESRGQNEKPH
jgi:hypothetical protein